jgi:aspartate aminotransferase
LLSSHRITLAGFMQERLTRRVRRLQPSATFTLARRALELKAAGKNVISFGLGEPDFDTPEPARAAAHRAIDSGKTHYTANEGIPELRRAIADWFAADQGVRYRPENEVLVTAGAKQGLAHAILALVEEGVGVLVPRPYWLTYPELIEFAGGVTQFVPTHAENGFHLEVEDLERVADARSRVLILNSPNNPTGAVLDERRLRAIAGFCRERDLFVISDEIYSALVFGEARHRSIVGADQTMRERTVVLNGMSKAFAMTGWRLGFALAPEPIMSALSRIQSHTTSNASSISQHAALGALAHCSSDVESMRRAFAERRQRVLEWLSCLAALDVPNPEGAFYVFPSVRKLLGRRSAGGARLTDSASFCEALLNEVLVSVVPGTVFGVDDGFRLSYAASLQELEEGCRRIARFVEGCK